MTWIALIASSVMGFFRKRPVAILYAAIGAAAIAFGWHYTGLVRGINQQAANQAVLEEGLKQQRKATESAVNRAKELAEDLAKFGQTVQRLEEIGRDVRTENEVLKERLGNLKLEQLISDSPDFAGATATFEHNNLIKLLECETDPARARDCRATGQDSTAPTDAGSTTPK